MMSDNDDTELSHLMDILIAEVTREPSPIREGTVMTPGPLPYRRLDCDGRALAYVRARPRKRMIRIDVSGLWVAPRRPEQALPNAGGTVAIAVRSNHDRAAAVGYLTEVVRYTREVQEVTDGEADPVREPVKTPG